jgi:hypothetical protein
MTKWLLIWVLGQGATAASLPDGQLFNDQASCDAAAKIVNDLRSGGGIGGQPIYVQARCIEIPVTADSQDR